MTAGIAPASACGLFQPTCGQAYAAPVYSGCNSGCGGGYAYQQLPEPEQQYYFANQGPTYSGPGNFAPSSAYEEGAVYQPPPIVTAMARRASKASPIMATVASILPPWRARTYWNHPRYGYEHRGYERYGYEHRGYEHRDYAYRGYEHRSYVPHYSMPPRAYYAPYHSMRYGYHGMPHHYGYRGYPLRRYY